MSKTTWSVKRFFVFVVAMSTLLLSVAVHAQQDQSSATFTSKEGAFSLTLPGTPKEKSEDITSNNGPTTLHTFMVERDEGQRFFLVGYSDYKTKLDADASLASVISGQVESLKGKITSDKTVTLAGHPGRSVTINQKALPFIARCTSLEIDSTSSCAACRRLTRCRRMPRSFSILSAF